MNPCVLEDDRTQDFDAVQEEAFRAVIEAQAALDAQTESPLRVQDPANESVTTNELNARLSQLVGIGLPAAARPPYLTIRGEYRSLNFSMNEHQLRAPAFRAMKKRPPRSSGADLDALTRDNMVIDLHWLHATGVRLQMNDMQFRDLLNTETFDFSVAEQYVGEEWRKIVRLARLKPTWVDQCQLSTLRSDEVRTRMADLEERRLVLRTHFRLLQQRGARLQSEDADDFADLWFAEALAQGGAHDLIGRIHGWRRGAPALSRPTLSLKLKRMRAWVEKAGT